jgi:excisionase family DNA binding protein
MAETMQFLTTEEVAKMLNHSVHSVRDKVKQGLLPGHRVGRKWLFDRDEVRAAIVDQALLSR